MKRKYALLTIFVLIACVVILGFIYKDNALRTRNIDFDFQFEVNDINGKSVSMHMIHNKPVIVAFFNTQCNLCLNEMPIIDNRLDEITKLYDVLFVSFEPPKSLEVYFSQYSILENSYTYIISDEREQLLQYYNIEGYPTFLIFNLKGRLVRMGNALSDDIISEIINKRYDY